MFGISFQSAFRAQRHLPADPLQCITVPDILKAIDSQTQGLLRLDDFVPIPCCAPSCGVATYDMLTEERVIPIPRLVPVSLYLDYIANRSMPNLDRELLNLLERLWSSGAKVGSDQATRFMLEALVRAKVPVNVPDPDWTGERCHSCRVGLPIGQHNTRDLGKHIFMISVRDFMDRKREYQHSIPDPQGFPCLPLGKGDAHSDKRSMDSLYGNAIRPQSDHDGRPFPEYPADHR